MCQKKRKTDKKKIASGYGARYEKDGDRWMDNDIIIKGRVEEGRKLI